MKIIRTAILARVSHDEQAKFGFSIDNQVDRLRAYAKENNLLIVDEYVDEGFSAGSMNRPALQRLLSELDRIDLIIFTKLDRFSRNVLDANEMVQLFDRKGVSIKAIDEDDVDTSTADGMFMFNLKVSLAQREIKKGSERITTVFDYKVKKGQPITGSLPIGYKIETKEDGNKHIIKDTETEHIINEIFEYFMKYQSVRATAIYINDKYNTRYTYNTFNRVLKREFYMGIYRGNENYSPAYIDRQTYNRIQEIMDNNIRTRKKERVHLLSGLVPCPKCGKKLVSHFKERIKKDGSKVQYHYYRCNSYFVYSDGCKVIYKEEHIENLLLQNIKSQAEQYIYKMKVKPIEVTDTSKQLKEVTAEMDRLNLQFRKGRIQEKEYDAEYEVLENRLKVLQMKAPKEQDLSGIEAFLNSGWENVYHSLSRADKRALIRSVVKTIRITGDSIDIDFV